MGRFFYGERGRGYEDGWEGKLRKKKEEKERRYLVRGGKLRRNTGLQAGKRAGVGISGPKLEEKRFEEVTRERFARG